ncbi:hypothetical protein BC939DRAFT_38500 [Gamsiella multidivaricata]|uniref:uncharacterized protein n=1 Tax=Gamsiella multidivaricata TaxID=101098 RepID=UPI002220A067|nr:uncharacterized protein BC939DRAFT_38500 [Gamsiella multidivaricata]KAI7828924.1 hypothetical protein BC939DRAFT_38500 [Gamsiella multidivaricata]
MVSLLRMQERRVKQQHVIKDMLLLKRTGQYDCATTFNYASGSVVDMAFKESTFKLAVANVTTQDIYNRQGNLLHCDLERGITKRLHGHWRQGEDPEQQLTYTVNDIKLSYSKDFFISGADDRRTMIWNAETGAHTSTFSDCQFKINRVAIMEDSVYHQDVFATCSSDGSIDIAALDETGQVAVRNRPLVVPGGRRGISSISFGYGHFWDCLAAGLEGLNNGLNNDGMQGQVTRTTNANMEKRVVSQKNSNYLFDGFLETLGGIL